MSEYKGQHTEQQIEKDPNPVKSWNLRDYLKAKTVFIM